MTDGRRVLLRLGALTRERIPATKSSKSAVHQQKDMVRAAGLEPAQLFRTEGFSYQLRLSPPCLRVFTHAGLFVVWTIPSPWRLRVRCCPSSLYTFTQTVRLERLARDCQLKGFPEFGQFYSSGFPEGTQMLKSLASTISPRPLWSPDQILSAFP